MVLCLVQRLLDELKQSNPLSRRQKLPPAGQALIELHQSGSVYRAGFRISEQGVHKGVGFALQILSIFS